MNTEISGSLELLELPGERDFLQEGRFALKSFAKQEGTCSHNAVRSGRFEGRGVETETFRRAGHPGIALESLAQ